MALVTPSDFDTISLSCLTWVIAYREQLLCRQTTGACEAHMRFGNPCGKDMMLAPLWRVRAKSRYRFHMVLSLLTFFNLVGLTGPYNSIG